MVMGTVMDMGGAHLHLPPHLHLHLHLHRTITQAAVVIDVLHLDVVVGGN